MECTRKPAVYWTGWRDYGTLCREIVAQWRDWSKLDEIECVQFDYCKGFRRWGCVEVDRQCYFENLVGERLER